MNAGAGSPFGGDAVRFPKGENVRPLRRQTPVFRGFRARRSDIERRRIIRYTVCA